MHDTIKTTIYLKQSEEDCERISFMADDIFAISGEIYKDQSLKRITNIYIPTDWDKEFLTCVENLTEEIFDKSFVTIRMANEDMSEELEKELKNMHFEDINFYCGFENSIPFLYTDSKTGLAVYNRMKEIHETQ